MEWDAKTDMLKRIIALLLSLAGLADRAAHLPHPVRWVVLKILRRAEIAGRKVVIAEARDQRVAPWLLASAAAHGGSTPSDAVTLAVCFRLLALALSNISALARRFARPCAGGAWRAALLECVLPSDLYRQWVAAPDTS